MKKYRIIEAGEKKCKCAEWLRSYARRICTNDATGNKRSDIADMLVSEALLKQTEEKCVSLRFGQDDQKIIEEGLERLSPKREKKCEHGIDKNNWCGLCEVSSPQPPQDWEKEFLWLYEHENAPEVSEIVYFIRALLEKTREEERGNKRIVHSYACSIRSNTADMCNECAQMVARADERRKTKQALLAKLRVEVEGMKKLFDKESWNKDRLLKTADENMAYNQSLSDILTLIDTLKE